MNKQDFEPLYQNEDELVSIRIGKPGQDSGAFIAFDATPDWIDRQSVRLNPHSTFNGYNHTAKL